MTVAETIGDDVLDAKELALREAVRALSGGVVVAFSGGVDSALLLKVCADELGSRVLAVTADSPSFPERDRADARRLAREFGVAHVFVETAEMDDERYRRNDAERCYFCKHSLFETLEPIARSSGLEHLAFGANLDDHDDYRPGHRAATKFSVRAPLAEAGCDKAIVRALARRLEVSIWNKPGSACLASRIPYGTAIDPEVLARIDSAEEALRALGLKQLRLRHHDSVARVEVDASELDLAFAQRGAIVAIVRARGWSHVALDLAGYKTGSLNAALG
jgi:pyridinium-3,5-biscarboxylic acid mononucleotide sulfurtransferase